jgi:hypothetical protein
MPFRLTFIEMPATIPSVMLLPSEAICWKATTAQPAYLPAGVGVDTARARLRRDMGRYAAAARSTKKNKERRWRQHGGRHSAGTLHKGAGAGATSARVRSAVQGDEQILTRKSSTHLRWKLPGPYTARTARRCARAGTPAGWMRTTSLQGRGVAKWRRTSVGVFRAAPAGTSAGVGAAIQRQALAHRSHRRQGERCAVAAAAPEMPSRRATKPGPQPRPANANGR